MIWVYFKYIYTGPLLVNFFLSKNFCKIEYTTGILLLRCQKIFWEFPSIKPDYKFYFNYYLYISLICVWDFELNENSTLTITRVLILSAPNIVLRNLNYLVSDLVKLLSVIWPGNERQHRLQSVLLALSIWEVLHYYYLNWGCFGSVSLPGAATMQIFCSREVLHRFRLKISLICKRKIPNLLIFLFI